MPCALARERGAALGVPVAAGRIAAPSAARRRQVLLRPPRQRDRNAAARRLVGEPHARRRSAPARREADAVLARPLRHRRRQGARLPHDAAAERDAARERVRASCATLLVGILQDPGDARVSRQRRERQEASQRELRPRAARAVHDGRRQLHRARRREAARAFTGWTNDVLAFKFDREQHDFGDKTFIGRTGPLDGTDIIDAILAQPVTAEFVAAKIYRFFVRDDGVASRSAPSSAARSASSGYQMKPLLKRHLPVEGLLQRRRRWRRRSRVPSTLVVSTLQEDWDCASCRPIPDFGRLTGGLGQALFDPPNVAGWAGGRTWITPATLLQRGNLFRDVLFADRGDVPRARSPDAGHLRASRREPRRKG